MENCSGDGGAGPQGKANGPGGGGARRPARIFDIRKPAAVFLTAAVVTAGGTCIAEGGCDKEAPPPIETLPTGYGVGCPPTVAHGAGIAEIRRFVKSRVTASAAAIKERMGAGVSDPVLVGVVVKVDGSGRPSVQTAVAACREKGCSDIENVDAIAGLDLSGLRTAAPMQDCYFSVTIAI